jgi:hypothetical protein
VLSLSFHDVNDINSAKARRKKDITRLLERAKETFQFPFACFEGECILSLAFLSSFVWKGHETAEVTGKG